MRILALVAPFVLALRLVAQESVDGGVIDRIEAEATAHSGVVATFDHLTNVIGPRLTGSPALKRAADWAADELRGMGLANVHEETFEFGRGWTLEGLTLEMTRPRYFPLVGYPEAWTPSTAGALEGRPVYVGDWSEEQIRARASQLRGRIVLPYRPMEAFITEDRAQPVGQDAPARTGAPPFLRPEASVDRRALRDALRDAGAGVMLAPNQGSEGTLFVLGDRTTPDDAVPSVVLASEHYDLIVRMIQAGEPVRMRVDVRARYHEEDTNGYNVLADIPGTDPEIGEEVVMLGAHLDSWHAATGATDNADAVASAMEAMRILKTLGVRPRRTIRLALWSGEEEGLLGSRAYVAEHYGPEDAESRDRLSVYLNHDPGRGGIYGWYMEDNAAAKAVFDVWLEPLKDVGARGNVLEGIGSTDHRAFTAAGLPGFNTVQDYRGYDVRTHHTNQDFYERMRPEDLREAAVVLATFLYHAAMRDAKIPRAPVS
jgi:carboxypeptidase Q